MRPIERKEFKAGDWVIRTKHSRGWEDLCGVRNLDPYKPLKIDAVVFGDPVFYALNEDCWFAEYFVPAAPLEDKNLEDYM